MLKRKRPWYTRAGELTIYRADGTVEKRPAYTVGELRPMVKPPYEPKDEEDDPEPIDGPYAEVIMSWAERQMGLAQ